MPDVPPSAEPSWQRVLMMSTKLIEALNQLHDAGGLQKLATTWKPASREKAKNLLAEAHRSLEAALVQLKNKPG